MCCHAVATCFYASSWVPNCVALPQTEQPAEGGGHFSAVCGFPGESPCGEVSPCMVV